jgi:hypothetical protein
MLIEILMPLSMPLKNMSNFEFNLEINLYLHSTSTLEEVPPQKLFISAIFFHLLSTNISKKPSMCL